MNTHGQTFTANYQKAISILCHVPFHGTNDFWIPSIILRVRSWLLVLNSSYFKDIYLLAFIDNCYELLLYQILSAKNICIFKIQKKSVCPQNNCNALLPDLRRFIKWNVSRFVSQARENENTAKLNARFYFSHVANGVSNHRKKRSFRNSNVKATTDVSRNGNTSFFRLWSLVAWFDQWEEWFLIQQINLH